LRITPTRHFRGRFTLPGDKSLSHRLAILAALAEGESRLTNFSTAEDCASTLNCLERLGVATRRRGRTVEVLGRGASGLRAPGRRPLDAGNSGSTLRMMAGVVAGRPFRTVLTGDASLRRRPVERVAEPLRAMGAKATSESGRPPLAIEGGALQGITWDLPVPSAQVKTAVLLAGLQAEGRTTVREPSPSRDHTERLLPAFGVALEREGGAVSVQGGATLSPVSLEVPGDASSAAFLVVAGLVVPDAFVHVEGVLLNPGRTAYLEVLREMGGQVETGVREEGVEPVGWIEVRSSRLAGVTVTPGRVASLIDEMPALAVAAAFAEGEFSVSGAAELRVKESDRIAAMVEGLSAMGADVTARPDGFVVRGGRPLRGAAVRAHADHRIAMALAVAGLAAEEGATTIEDGRCVAVSFPEFPALLERGARAER
jgi:3-phosphoshikimate 1-carboxyvinyltransferase